MYVFYLSHVLYVEVQLQSQSFVTSPVLSSKGAAWYVQVSWPSAYAYFVCSNCTGCDGVLQDETWREYLNDDEQSSPCRFLTEGRPV